MREGCVGVISSDFNMVWTYGIVFEMNKMMRFAKICSHLCLLSDGSGFQFSCRSDCRDLGGRLMRVSVMGPIHVGLGRVLSGRVHSENYYPWMDNAVCYHLLFHSFRATCW